MKLIDLYTEQEVLTEAATGVFHEWKECGNSSGPSVNFDGIGFWVNGPGWNVGTQTGGSPTYPWATHQNSAAFWTFLQQPQPGTIVGFTVNNSAGNNLNIWFRIYRNNSDNRCCWRWYFSIWWSKCTCKRYILWC